VKNIIGQEAHHAFNFIKWTEHLVKSYPAITTLDDHAKEYFVAQLNRDKRFKIGLTAGYETFTFYEELMAEADPVILALWVWHQVEEVEHGAVAFEFYPAFLNRSKKRHSIDSTERLSYQVMGTVCRCY